MGLSLLLSSLIHLVEKYFGLMEYGFYFCRLLCNLLPSRKVNVVVTVSVPTGQQICRNCSHILRMSAETNVCQLPQDILYRVSLCHISLFPLPIFRVTVKGSIRNIYTTNAPYI